MDDLGKVDVLVGVWTGTLEAATTAESVSEWAGQHRWVSSSISAFAGQWQNDLTPYLVGVMNAAGCDDPCSVIVFKKSNQIGGTEAMLNSLGYRIHQWPSPMMIVVPKDEDVNKYVTTRVDPWIESTPILKSLIGKTEDGADAADNTKIKRFPGGQIYVSASKSAATYREKPLCVVVLDDLDAFFPNPEGDHAMLALKRTNTFASRARKVLMISTPTEADTSRIAAEYEQTSQRIHELQCPYCGQWFALWRRLFRYVKGEPSTAHFVCEHCESPVYEAQRRDLLASGRWTPQRPELVGHREGFWIWAAYAPFVRWSELAQNLMDAFHEMEARHNSEKLQAALNLDWAECFVPEANLRLQGEEAKAFARREPPWIRTTLPIALTTAGVDVQKDRLEMAVLDWALDGQVWLEHFVIRGAYDSQSTWDTLTDALVSLGVHCVCIDYGAPTTTSKNDRPGPQQTLDNVLARAERLLQSGCAPYVIKGFGGPGPLWPHFIQPPNLQNERIAPVPIYVDNAKDWVYKTLQIERPGPGYLHISTRQNKQFFKSLFSERKRDLRDPRAKSRYVVVQGRERNEALDCTVYGYTALWARSTFDQIARKILGLKDPVADKPKGKPKPVRSSKRNPFTDDVL